MNVECFPKSRRGVALILTLILLSVALVMALAFLAISGRDRNSVSTQTDEATTRLAANAALSAAEAQIAANVLASTNPYSFGLLVSTNYLPPPTGNPVADLTNFFILPRAPVWLSNTVTHVMENRFYLDLNRNGRYDTNGPVGDFVLNPSGQPIFDGTTNFEVGDPEWIGILAHPDQPYGPNNLFIARYAFIALPAGNTLDLNAIHNQTLNRYLIPSQDGYFRNQGVGSWELNLAAFLADLNNNEWDSPGPGRTYQYNRANPTPITPPNRGTAFDDARALLAYRYDDNYNTLASVDRLFNLPGDDAFRHDGIDGYDDGPLQTGVQPPGDVLLPVANDNPLLPWAGADNTNHFFDLAADLFDPAKSSVQFTNRLLSASRGLSTYDRYTFYRLLAQLGADSDPVSGRMNLNYDNLDPYVFVNGNPVASTNGVASETNFVPWQPLAFFTNAADRMLRTYTTEWFKSNPSDFLATYYGITNYNYSYVNSQGVTVINDPNGIGLTNVPFYGMTNQIPSFGVTDIPVLANRSMVYTPAVQRLLQLAANIYDATTTNYFPTVFRPVFEHDKFGNVFIVGYTPLYTLRYGLNTVTGPGDPQLTQPLDVSSLTNLSPVFTPITDANGYLVNVYGVPWIIGAKKGFPNFNEFVQENIVGVTRRLQVTRDLGRERAGLGAIYLTRTNQMYIFSLHSSMGLDFWNSYNANFPDDVTVVYRGSTMMALTNDDPGFDSHPGITQPMGFIFANTNRISGWPGTAPWVGGQPNPASFFTPLNYPDYPMMMPSVYRTPYAGNTPGTLPAGFTAPCLIPTNYFAYVLMPTLFETNTPGFPLPNWGLLTTNHLQVFILDNNNSRLGGIHVIDYVQLEDSSSRNLNAEIFTDPYNGIAPPDGVWNTNIDSLTGVPYGIENQIKISKGLAGVPGTEDGIWQGDPEAFQYGTTPPTQQASFQAFFMPYGQSAVVDGWGGYSGAMASNYLSSVQAPYAPTRFAVSYAVLQANDPLVHYLASDLTPSALPAGVMDLPLNFNNSLTNMIPLTGARGLDLGSLNANYRPWGGNPTWPQVVPQPNAYNLAERDPGVRQSDDWDFPSNKLATVGWIGRVHRGTPWQTVYLKSPGINTNTWAQWTGDNSVSYNQYFDAGNSAPVSDRLLFDLFTTAPNGNATRGTLSVNAGAGNPDPAADLAAWSAVFSGIVVPTNSLGGYTVINPAGPAGTNSDLGRLVANINSTRFNFRNPDGLTGVFEHKGDILAAPALTVANPWILQNNSDTNNGISDAMYEWLPQQVMSLLRDSDSPRYVIYCYGQALKPAPPPNGVFINGGLLYTNYQVVSETATRAVVRFDTTRTNAVSGAITVTPPRAVITRFNILPPN